MLNQSTADDHPFVHVLPAAPRDAHDPLPVMRREMKLHKRMVVGSGIPQRVDRASAALVAVLVALSRRLQGVVDRSIRPPASGIEALM